MYTIRYYKYLQLDLNMLLQLKLNRNFGRNSKLSLSKGYQISLSRLT